MKNDAIIVIKTIALSLIVFTLLNAVGIAIDLTNNTTAGNILGFTGETLLITSCIFNILGALVLLIKIRKWSYITSFASLILALLIEIGVMLKFYVGIGPASAFSIALMYLLIREKTLKVA